MTPQVQRFQRLHRGPLEAYEMSVKIADLYRLQIGLDISHIPKASPEKHTMFNALDRYVAQKLPTDAVDAVLNNRGRFEVHGIYPKHFEGLFGNRLESGDLQELDFYHRPTTRKYNVVRPRYFKSARNDQFIICLAPGTDYIKHYGSMLRHYCQLQDVSSNLQLLHYPMASASLAFWTRLNHGFVWEDDTVIIGYVDEISKELENWVELAPLSTASNPFFESRRYQLANGRCINFLGVNFSFWGNLAQAIVFEICKSKASELIYVGKLGSMTTPDSLYRTLFSPTEYATFDHNRIVNVVRDVKNGLVSRFPELNTGMHVSVPTVIEEDYLQRELCSSLRAQSIDNEISQIAKNDFRLQCV